MNLEVFSIIVRANPKKLWGKKGGGLTLYRGGTFAGIMHLVVLTLGFGVDVVSRR
jgi:hypothetical protein